MESPYFSIIIPALNEEKYISGLLKSLINQTYKEFEVILVDGMSADKTVSVFKKFQNKLPRSQYLVAENALRILAISGLLSSLFVISNQIRIPYN